MALNFKKELREFSKSLKLQIKSTAAGNLFTNLLTYILLQHSYLCTSRGVKYFTQDSVICKKRQ